MFSPFSVTIPHVAYACLGGFVVLFGMFSLFIRERLYIGEACCAFLFGVIIGPYGANIFNPRGWAGGSVDVTDTITLEFTRVVLAIGVFAIGVELPKAYMFRHWRSLMFLLGPVMTWGWFVAAGLIYALIPGLNFLSSLAVAACLTPTDPILAAAVVGGKYADKHVPAHLRHLLAAESGCNDGAALAFLYISLFLILDAPNTGKAIQDWFLILWLYDVILGIVIGAVLGISFRYLMKYCQKHDLIDRQSYVAQYVSLALLTIGITTMLGVDDLLAAFTCGSAFAWDGFFNRQTEESVFSSVIDLLFNIGTFIYVGAWMPFSSFHNPETTLSVWRLVVIAILILLLKRLPAIIILYRWIPDIKTLREAVFSGHFGPIGIGAVFISTFASDLLSKGPEHVQTKLLAEAIQPIVAFMVLCSIVIHGLSVPFFSLGRHASRTWSRHATAPDWTNQTRLVDRGADIVINKDADVEKGFEIHDEKASTSGGNEAHGFKSEQATAVPSTDGFSIEEEPKRVSNDAEARPDPPPDGDENVQEWQEGRYQVIERRTGPGEEVDVDVILAPEEPEETPSSQGNTDAVHRTIAAYLDKIKLGSSNENGKAWETDTSESPGSTVAVPSRGMSLDGVEDAGWDSDQSHAEPGSSSPKQLTPTGSILIHSHPHKRKVPHHHHQHHQHHHHHHHHHHQHQKAPIRNRRHSLIHRSSSSYGHQAATVVERGEGEGRNPTVDEKPHPRPSTAPNSRLSSRLNSPCVTRPSSLRNLRLDHIRAHEARSSREHSPSRSIRFVDDDITTTSNASPRSTILLQDSYTDALNDAPTTNERTQVTFDLPPVKP